MTTTRHITIHHISTRHDTTRHTKYTIPGRRHQRGRQAKPRRIHKPVHQIPTTMPMVHAHRYCQHCPNTNINTTLLSQPLSQLLSQPPLSLQHHLYQNLTFSMIPLFRIKVFELFDEIDSEDEEEQEEEEQEQEQEEQREIKSPTLPEPIVSTTSSGRSSSCRSRSGSGSSYAGGVSLR